MNYEQNLNTILEFLEDNPMFYPGTNSNSERHNYLSDDMKLTTKRKYYQDVEKIGNYQKKPGKQSWDPVWSLIIENKFPNIVLPDSEEMAFIKSYQKAAEQIGGNILEHYIDSVIAEDNWIWALGAVVSHTDFIKKEAGGSWSLLQIKSRYNTENAAAKSSRTSLVRETGLEILHWYRFKMNGDTNWEDFPLRTPNLKLSEENFKNFISDNLQT